ncbi:HIT domain [Chromobacterium violaceum]|uniref:HIT domain n=1 Tax=Chromobacterium violaceum TaxID=536 RepID=A0A3S4LM68_CHRVL|nr:HIT domain [Chromobacterium violaceum]
MPATAGDLLYQNDKLWLVLVDEPATRASAACLEGHVKEMTDLSSDERQHLMDWVWRAEAAVRQVMQPAKVNLASLGNVVPHLHWHVIPRFEDDAHFPSPIWAAPRREAPARAWPGLADRLRQALRAG